jgi:transposase-like protein
MKIEQQWCDNLSCPDFGQVNASNIKVYSHAERRYYCTTCEQTFSFERGTFFETLRTERPILLDTIAMLVERNSLRAISRVKDVRPNSVLHWLDLAGQHAAALSQQLIHDLHIKQAQIDELWTFVKKNRSIFNPPTGTMSVKLGFGERLPCPATYVWRIISHMNGARRRQPVF